jgi:hypothetical protein
MHLPNQINMESEKQAALKVADKYARKRAAKAIAVSAAAIVLAAAIFGGVILHLAQKDARDDFVAIVYTPQEEQPGELVRHGALSHLPAAGAEIVKTPLEDVVAHPERYGTWEDTDGDGKQKPSRKEVIEQVWHLPGGGAKDMNGNGRIGYYDKANQPLGLRLWEEK